MHGVNCLETLCNGLEHYNVTGNGKRKCLKSFKYGAISSQGTSGEVQGSTTRVYGLEQIMKLHERTATF
ncbi:MAG: hypothetical protein WBF90_33665 [Rivularia sp. (in: cyanobacteria)]